MKKVGYMNVYRSGWFHRKGKPNTIDRHAGDFYESWEQAKADIDPPSHYVDTVRFEWEEEDPPCANCPDSVPVPLSVSRKEHRETEFA